MNSCVFNNTISNCTCSAQLSFSLPLICSSHLANIFNLEEKFVSLPPQSIECMKAKADIIGVKLFAFNPDSDNIVFNENDTIIPVSEYFRSYFDALSKNEQCNINSSSADLYQQHYFSQLLHLGHALLNLCQYFKKENYTRYKLCKVIIHLSQKLRFDILLLGIRKGSIFSNYSEWLFKHSRKHISIENKYRFSRSIDAFLSNISHKSKTRFDDTSKDFRLLEINEAYNKSVVKIYFENYLFEGNFLQNNEECKLHSNITINALYEIYSFYESMSSELRIVFYPLLLNQYNFIENKSRYIFSNVISPQVLNMLQCCFYPISIVEHKEGKKIYYKYYLQFLFHEVNLESLIKKLSLTDAEEYLIAQGISLQIFNGPQIISVNYNDITLNPVSVDELVAYEK